MESLFVEDDAKVSLPSSPLPSPQPASHEGPLDGATLTGQVARRHLSVRIGLWLDDGGAPRRARWRSTDEEVRPCAELACALIERGLDPLALDSGVLRAAALGRSAAHGDGAEIVLAALRAALALNAPPRPRG